MAHKQEGLALFYFSLLVRDIRYPYTKSTQLVKSMMLQHDKHSNS